MAAQVDIDVGPTTITTPVRKEVRELASAIANERMHQFSEDDETRDLCRSVRRRVWDEICRIEPDAIRQAEIWREASVRAERLVRSARARKAA